MKHSDFPALYQSASDLSQNAQNNFYRAFLGYMIFLAIASGISVVNSSDPNTAIVQALVLFGVLGLAVYLYVVKPERHWYSGRAVAESIKTITWRYVSRAEPFNNSDEIDKHNFVLKLRAIIEQNKDVAGLFEANLNGLQITDKMKSIRAGSSDARLVNYKECRIFDQLSWYAKKAAINKNNVNFYFILLIIVICIAIIFSLTKIQYPKAQFWPTDFFVTVAAGVLSWIQTKRYQELSVSYALTAHEISLIREQANKPMTELELSQFIGDSENAFSREHTQWIARRDS